MGKRLLLKDHAGKPAGYLVQEEHELRCRAPFNGTAELYIWTEDMECQRYPIEGKEGECSIPPCSGKIQSACIEAGNVLRYVSSDEAGKLWQRDRAERALRCLADLKRAKHEEDARKKRTISPEVGVVPVSEDERRSYGGQELNRTEGMYRWPPPPCVPGARFMAGRWSWEL